MISLKISESWTMQVSEEDYKKIRGLFISYAQGVVSMRYQNCIAVVCPDEIIFIQGTRMVRVVDPELSLFPAESEAMDTDLYDWPFRFTTEDGRGYIWNGGDKSTGLSVDEITKLRIEEERSAEVSGVRVFRFENHAVVAVGGEAPATMSLSRWRYNLRQLINNMVRFQ